MNDIKKNSSLSSIKRGAVIVVVAFLGLVLFSVLRPVVTKIYFQGRTKAIQTGNNTQSYTKGDTSFYYVIVGGKKELHKMVRKGNYLFMFDSAGVLTDTAYYVPIQP